MRVLLWNGSVNRQVVRVLNEKPVSFGKFQLKISFPFILTQSLVLGVDLFVIAGSIG